MEPLWKAYCKRAGEVDGGAGSAPSTMRGLFNGNTTRNVGDIICIVAGTFVRTKDAIDNGKGYLRLDDYPQWAESWCFEISETDPSFFSNDGNGPIPFAKKR